MLIETKCVIEEVHTQPYAEVKTEKISLSSIKITGSVAFEEITATDEEILSFLPAGRVLLVGHPGPGRRLVLTP